MSAICGLINFDGAPIDRELLRKMAGAGSHHGPDGIHYWIDGHVGMAHLAFHTTPEAVRERQPLVSADGKLCLTADARVDNRPELTAELSKQGYDVTENSTDADLILAAYQSWGEACAEHIIGDFAFAVWDDSRGHIYCARDFLGMKPLVYYRAGSFFCFASEAQQILQHPAVPWRLDEISMADFLAVNNGDQTRTMFENIWNTPPAHSMIVGPDQLVLRQYWYPENVGQIRYSRREAYADHFGEVFKRAVQDRLRTVCPTIGIQLSGGLDSSSIAVTAHELLQEKVDRRLTAVTLVYDELDFEDERSYSRVVADKLGINLQLLANDGANLLTGVERVELETPYRGWERTEKNILEQFQQQGVQIILTGIGGDDLVSGSALIYGDRIRHGDLTALLLLWRDARVNQESFGKILNSWFVRPYLRRFRGRQYSKDRADEFPLPYSAWILDDFAKRTNLAERLQDKPPIPSRSWARQVIYNSVTHMGDVYRSHLNWLSRLAVECRIEYRHPFLDRRLSEVVLGLPPEQLWRGGFSKYVLRQAMGSRLPDPIRFRRSKTTYLPVIHHRLRVGEGRHISQLLEAPLVAKLGFVDGQILRDILDSYLAGGGDGRTALNLIRLVSLEVWLLNHPELII